MPKKFRNVNFFKEFSQLFKKTHHGNYRKLRTDKN